MKNIEYNEMAQYYDDLYKNKDYKTEVNFISDFIKNSNDFILDAGCGTGNHAKIIYNKYPNVFGFDLSESMVNIANSKINGHFEIGNILNYKTDKKFDLIISFYAVFNHLRNYKQFKMALSNLKKLLNENGTIIIDLHNPLKSGKKIDKIENITRLMKWRIYKFLKIEKTKITYTIDNKIFKTSHKFKIYNIDKLKKICEKIGFKEIAFYENYNIKSNANKFSKNIQIVLQ